MKVSWWFTFEVFFVLFCLTRHFFLKSKIDVEVLCCSCYVRGVMSLLPPVKIIIKGFVVWCCFFFVTEYTLCCLFYF